MSRILRTLPAFTAKPVCVKCGSRDIHRSYHAKDGCEYGCGSVLDGAWIEAEHHRLDCRGCGYHWATSVKAPS